MPRIHILEIFHKIFFCVAGGKSMDAFSQNYQIVVNSFITSLAVRRRIM